MQTMQQRRAAFALNGVQRALKEFRKDHETNREPKACKELRAYASEFPFMIHANGLGQAAAFFLSKSKDKSSKAHDKLYKLLSDWLVGQGINWEETDSNPEEKAFRENQPFAGKTDLMDGITTSDMHKYLAAQAEAMLFMQWVKQFATAYVATD